MTKIDENWRARERIEQNMRRIRRAEKIMAEQKPDQPIHGKIVTRRKLRSKRALKRWEKRQRNKTPQQIQIAETIEIIHTIKLAEEQEALAIRQTLITELSEHLNLPDDATGKFQIGNLEIEVIPPHLEIPIEPNRREMENTSVVMETDVWMMRDVAAAVLGLIE